MLPKTLVKVISQTATSGKSLKKEKRKSPVKKQETAVKGNERTMFGGAVPATMHINHLRVFFKKYGKVKYLKLAKGFPDENSSYFYVEYSDLKLRVPEKKKLFIKPEFMRNHDHCVVVKNLPKNCKQVDLVRAFECTGKISRTYPKSAQKSKSVAYIYFENADDAKRVLDVGEFKVNDRQVVVSKFHTKKQIPSKRQSEISQTVDNNSDEGESKSESESSN